MAEVDEYYEKSYLAESMLRQLENDYLLQDRFIELLFNNKRIADRVYEHFMRIFEDKLLYPTKEHSEVMDKLYNEFMYRLIQEGRIDQVKKLLKERMEDKRSDEERLQEGLEKFFSINWDDC